MQKSFSYYDMGFPSTSLNAKLRYIAYYHKHYIIPTYNDMTNHCFYQCCLVLEKKPFLSFFFGFK